MVGIFGNRSYVYVQLWDYLKSYMENIGILASWAFHTLLFGILPLPPANLAFLKQLLSICPAVP